MLVAQFEKQPGETKRRTIDYSCRFDDGQTISSVTGVAELEGGGTSALTVNVYVLPSATEIEYFVSGGATGELHKITFTTSVSDGQVMEDEVECFVEEH